MPPVPSPKADTAAAAPSSYTPAPSAVRLPAEAVYTGDITASTHSPRARLVQEWLTLGGVGVMIDSHFGPATAAAVRAYQRKVKLPSTGVVDEATFGRLTAPMAAALTVPSFPPGTPLGTAVVAIAKQHLAQSPREVGGQNSGPWVRLYMDGNQGAAWPWCCGFATFVLAQACAALGRPMPLGRTFSCDVLAERARAAGRLVQGRPDDPARAIPPGSLFLVRRAPGDWEHIGIVTAARPDAFHTIEGNTNDAGDREGYEVCSRVRGYERKDFVRIA
jgi:hypothetical protein